MQSHGLLESRRLVLALPQSLNRIGQIVHCHGPVERYALAGIFIQHLLVSSDGLLNPFSLSVALAQSEKGTRQIILRHCPVERHALAGLLLQGGPKSGHSLFERRAPTLALS